MSLRGRLFAAVLLGLESRHLGVESFHSEYELSAGLHDDSIKPHSLRTSRPCVGTGRDAAGLFNWVLSKKNSMRWHF